MNKRFFPWLMCGLGAAFYCYEYILRILPSVMLTDLMQFYGLSAAGIGQLTAFYYYIYTPMQLPLGVLMDKYSPRFMLSFACGICVVGTYLFFLTSYFWIAACGRFLVGFGSAFAFVGVLKLATLWLPPERFALVSGLTTMLGMLGATFGTVVIDGMVTAFGWQYANYVCIFVGIILCLLLLAFIKEPSTSAQLQEDHDSSEAMSFDDLKLGLGKVLGNSQIWANGAIGGLLYASLSVFAEMWGISFIRQAHGYDANTAAQAVSMVFLGWAVGAPVVGWLSDWLKKRKLPMFAGIFFGTTSIAAILYISDLPCWLISTLLFIYGACCSVQVVVFAVGRENSSPWLAGTSLAVTNMFVMLSGVLFQPLVGIVLDVLWDGQYHQGLPSYSIDHYRIALSVLPIGMVIALCLLFSVKETHARLSR